MLEVDPENRALLLKISVHNAISSSERKLCCDHQVGPDIAVDFYSPQVASHGVILNERQGRTSLQGRMHCWDMKLEQTRINKNQAAHRTAEAN